MDTDTQPIHTATKIGQAYYENAIHIFDQEQLSLDTKVIAASNLAIAMAIAQLAAAISGGIDGSPLSEAFRLLIENKANTGAKNCD